MHDADDAPNVHQQGTGGLTLEPPEEESSDLAIGFAHDILEGVEPHPEFAHLEEALDTQENTSTSAAHLTPSPPPSEGFEPKGSAANAMPVGDYPLARASITRLLGHQKETFATQEATASPSSLPSQATSALSEPLSEKKKTIEPSSAVPGAFLIGPDVMRPPAKVQTPSLPSTSTREVRSETSAQMENMVDLFFAGAEEENQEQQIHLQFKEDILGGLYLTLKKTDAGMVAHFVVNDKNTRRLVESQAHSLVARLEKKGIHVVDTLVEVRGAAAEKEATHDYFSTPDHFEEF
ncbi:MAG: hypothetical protein GY822_30095 [Deltaproteobacteria bacterium]|nr:hypothetical protein [Deltaproteobacteria bacterium]